MSESAGAIAPAFVWDLSVTSADALAPALTDRFSIWLDSAHDVLESWFFAMIDRPVPDRAKAARA